MEVILETGPAALVSEKNEEADAKQAGAQQPQAQQPAKRKAPVGLGNAELTRLWGLGNQWKIKSDEGSNVSRPAHESFLDRIKEGK